MKTNKIDATTIALLSAFAFLSGCGEEQKEEVKQAEQAISESKSAEPVSKLMDSATEMLGKTGGAIESAAESGMEKTSEALGSVAKPAMEKTAEAMSGAADQTLEKASEASQDLMSAAKTATIKAEETVKEAASDAREVVKTTPEQVRKIQQALIDAGFNPGPVDGMIGSKTMSALASFQRQKGLVEGQITKETLRALGVLD